MSVAVAMLGRVRHESARRMFELFGIITTAQLLASGKSRDEIRTMVRRGGNACAGKTTTHCALARRLPPAAHQGSRLAGGRARHGLQARDRWRAVNAPHLVVLVRAGAVFVNGKLVERPGEDAPPQAA
jgi:hypothetical protein